LGGGGCRAIKWVGEDSLSVKKDHAIQGKEGAVCSSKEN